MEQHGDCNAKFANIGVVVVWEQAGLSPLTGVYVDGPGVGGSDVWAGVDGTVFFGSIIDAGVDGHSI